MITPEDGSSIIFHIKAATISEIMSGNIMIVRKNNEPFVIPLRSKAIPKPIINSAVKDKNAKYNVFFNALQK